MNPLSHYPAVKRWRWSRRRCTCGLLLNDCPDWRSFLTALIAEAAVDYRQSRLITVDRQSRLGPAA